MLDKKQNNGIISTRFSISKSAPKHPAVDDRRRDSTYFYSGLLFVLIVFTGLAYFFQRGDSKQYYYIPENYPISIEQIPETRISNNLPPPPPKKPVVPVESDIEEIFEELVWEMETLDYVDLPDMPPHPGKLGGIGQTPRPLFESWPEYPDSEIKKGHSGVVEVNVWIDEKGKVTKVEVVKNTTNSDLLERIAVESAYKTVYLPAKDTFNKPIPAVTPKTYRFGGEK